MMPLSPAHFILLIRLLLLSLIGTALFLTQPVVAQSPAPPPVIAVDPPPGIGTMPADLVRSFADTPRPSKLDSTLADLWLTETRRQSGSVVEPLVQRYPDLRFDQNRIQVQIWVAEGSASAISAQVEALGGEITGMSLDNFRLQGWVRPDSLGALIAQHDVTYVRIPSTLELLGTGNEVINSEALSAFNVTAWHRSGITGKGRRVGIIDGGFKGYADLRGSELPGVIVGRNFADKEPEDAIDGPTNHGTAVAEIIHDVAPDGSFYLARIATDIDLKEAVLWLIEQDVDVIATAVGWYNLTPGDGTGYFAELATLAEAAGILWVTAVGNDREHHWGGAFSDQDQDLYHEFNGNQEINYFGPGNGQIYVIPPGVRLALHARWSDWETVREDYDLLLVRWNGREWKLATESRNPQEGIPGQMPTETLHFITDGEPTYYGFALVRYRGDPAIHPHFEIFMPKFYRPGIATANRSLINLADVADILSVAAIDVAHPFDVQAYSAEGPTNGPGGVAEGGFPKPELAAYTNITTASSESRPFNGTSAAAPHVAGAALLIADAYPEWGVQQIRNFLKERALPLSLDTMRTGHGRLHLGVPPTNLSNSSLEMTSIHTDEGEIITTTVNIVNSQRITSTVSLNNPLPAHLTLTTFPTASVDPQPTLSNRRVSWSSSLMPGEIVTITYAGILQPAASGRLHNTATISEITGATMSLSITYGTAQVFVPLVYNAP